MHGKATETAIAAMGYLAEHFDDDKRCSAAEIASARKLQGPFVSKVLTELARAGLVVGVRGPGGGFSLSRSPDEIALHEVYDLFERGDGDACPFGGGVCGEGDPCPLHDRFAAVRKATDRILHETTFGVFRRKRSKQR